MPCLHECHVCLAGTLPRVPFASPSPCIPPECVALAATERRWRDGLVPSGLCTPELERHTKKFFVTTHRKEHIFMSVEENKALIRRYREAHNTNNLAALDEIVAANIVSHNGLPGLPPGLEG